MCIQGLGTLREAQEAQNGLAGLTPVREDEAHRGDAVDCWGPTSFGRLPAAGKDANFWGSYSFHNIMLRLAVQLVRGVQKSANFP